MQFEIEPLREELHMEWLQVIRDSVIGFVHPELESCSKKIKLTLVKTKYRVFQTVAVQ